jgi:hypothetical protein
MKRVIDYQQKDISKKESSKTSPRLGLKRFIILAFFIGGSQLTVEAQYNIQSSDMLLYSQQYPWGTARSMGMSGAFGALGADQSSLSINPAGIGFYRTSDLSLTLSLNHNNAESNFYGNKNSDFSEKLGIGNIGYVYTYNTLKDEGWVTASFGIAYNQVNDFNRNVVIKNPKATSSLLDEFVYYANGGENKVPVDINMLNPYYEGLAYEYYALDKNKGRYVSDFTTNDNQYGQYQERRRNITGGTGEYAFSAGANYSHQLYIGATIGIQDLSYKEVTTHTEVDQNNNIPNLQSFVFTENFKTTGTGYNFKFGAIYKPIDLLRLGLAIHSPTLFVMNSEFYTTIETNLDPDGHGGNTYYAGAEGDSRKNYNSMTSPWKTITSIALVQPFGLIDFDYEHLDYSTMQLSGDVSTGINTPNDYVKSDYKGVNNFRVGAEIKAGDFAIRGGFGYYSSPYTYSNLTFINYKTYSAGIGYRGANFYMDLGYTIIKYPDSYLLYSYTEQQSNGAITYLNNPTVSDINYNLKRITATFGYKF